MGKLIGGWLLLGVAALMLLGFARSDAVFGDPATILALLFTVAAPAAGGVWLLLSSGQRRAALLDRREILRQQVLDAEVLRLAGERGDRITIIELVTELSLSPEAAKAALNDLMRRGLVDIEVTESGGIVYTVPDLRQLTDRDSSQGLLDA
ncbi:hypothetical protein BH23GEM9_BH23GEM9_16470 [soil metagenome]